MSQKLTINANGMVSVLRDLVPNINPQIADLTYKEATLLYDLMPMKTTPYFNGDVFHKQVYYGYQSPNAFTEEWEDVRKSSPGNSHEPAHSACGTKWYERKDGAEMVAWGLKKKSLKTEAFCLDDWAYANFAPEFIQGKIDSLAGVVQGELENFVIAELFRMAQKFVIPASGGFYQANEVTKFPIIPSGNPLGRLSIDLFTKLHTRMVNNRVPAGLMLGGGKSYFAIGNAEDISDFLYHDPNLKEDTRFSSMADDRLLRYNITDQFRGLFAFVNYAKMPRANINAITGEVEYVFPQQNDVPTQIGVRNAQNEEYYTAKYHTMLFIGQAPAALVKPGGEEAMIEAFRPKNPDFNWQLAIDPCSYPKNNVVWFWTEATLGWEPGNYPYVYVGLFRRRDEAYMAQDWGTITCITEPTPCDNDIPDQECPCPMVLSARPGFVSTNLIFTLDKTTGLVALDPISFQLANGGVATGAVVQVSADGLTVEVIFAGATPSLTAGWYVSVLCTDVGICSSDVLCVTNPTAGNDQVTLQLFRKLVDLTAGDDINVYFCDGTSAVVDYVSANLATFEYVVSGALATNIETLIAEHGTIVSVCVVPTVGNGCPACGPTYTECA